MAEKDTLVKQSADQVDNYKVKPGSFKKSNGAQTSSGKDQLCPEGGYLGSPRNCQDGGDLTPSDWGKNSFTVKKTSGGEEGKSLSVSEGVDLVTGKITGYSGTRVGEIGDRNLSIASR